MSATSVAMLMVMITEFVPKKKAHTASGSWSRSTANPNNDKAVMASVMNEGAQAPVWIGQPAYADRRHHVADLGQGQHLQSNMSPSPMATEKPGRCVL